MHDPIYKLTLPLINDIGVIERLYGQIEAMQIPKKLELNLERHNLIQSSYASNRIEGNPLTLPEVTNLLLDDRVPVNRDEKEVVNYFSILKNLDSYKNQKISLDMILDFHNKLLNGIDETAGLIRNVKVVVGKFKEEHGDVSLRVKHDPPFHTRDEISKALEELLVWAKENEELPPVIRAGLFHHQFVYIHPFEDGNGRVCRISTALLLLQSGYMINRYFILDDYYDIDRTQYSDKLHTADTGEKSQWLEYFSEGVKYSLQSALAKFREAIRTLKFEEKPTPKEHMVLELIKQYHEVTAPEVGNKLGVTRQQSHALLKSLVDKGLVEKKGSTKSSYYFLK